PWITPLMIAGIALVILGIALLIWRFVEFRRRAKRTSGRRAAVRGDYTGVTAADVRVDTSAPQQTMTMQQVDDGEPVTDYDTEYPTEIVGSDDTSAAADDEFARDELDQRDDSDHREDNEERDGEYNENEDDHTGGSSSP